MNTEDVNETIAWHFTGSTLRDGSPIPAIGQTLIFPGKIEICKAGYHWSRRPVQALLHAPGPFLHKVSFGGDVIEQADQGVSSERTILASIDITHLLRRFTADRSLSVAHLWDMPDIVREYLTTLDESKRDAAWDAAWAADRAGLNAEGIAEFYAAIVAIAATIGVDREGYAFPLTFWDRYYRRPRDAESDARRSRIDAVEFDRRVYNAFQKEVG